MSLTDFVDALCKESTAEAVNELSVFISAIYTQENDRDDILHMRLVNVERWAKDQGIRWNLLYPMVQALAVATVEPEEQSRFKSIWDTFTTEKVSIVDIGNMLADRYPQTLETFLEIINYVIKEKDEIENVSGGISRAWEYGGGSVAIGGSLFQEKKKYTK
jgi:hypothetical protein